MNSIHKPIIKDAAKARVHVHDSLCARYIRVEHRYLILAAVSVVSLLGLLLFASRLPHG